MEIPEETESLFQTNNTLIKIPLALIEENEHNEITNINGRERRIAKAKVINDLRFEKTSSFLNKKAKRSKQCPLAQRKNSKDTSNVTMKIMNHLKSILKYQDYPLFIQIQNNIKANKYNDHKELCSDIRLIFSEYFNQFSFDPQKYCKLLTLYDLFENQYKEYAQKEFNRESKNMIEIKRKLNHLKKELRESNNQHMGKDNNNNYNHFPSSLSSGNNNQNNNNNNSYDKYTNKKYKVQLAKDIKRLTQEQKKGIASILSKECLDLNNNTMEIDVNKIPNCQLRELEKYIKNCIRVNSTAVSINNSNLNKEQINVNMNNINNNFLLQKADSTMNSLNQEIQSEKEKNENSFLKREVVFSDNDSDSDSFQSDDSDSDLE